MTFDEVAGWGEDAWMGDVTGVAVDSRDRVYVLRRGDDPVTVLSPDGTIVDRWGSGRFSNRPHLISIGDDDTVYVADDGAHRVFIFEPTGRLLEVIGTGEPSKTGYDDSGQGAEAALDGMRGGPPFNRPTKVAPGRDGDLFVSDGYRNCRVHRFSADRRLLRSWGGPGAGDGCFVIPHSVVTDREGRVMVCDRENDRIQIFSFDGELLDVWNDVRRPTDIAFDRQGRVYVTELPRGPADLKSWRLGRAEKEWPGRVTIRMSDGSIVGGVPSQGVAFPAAHAIAIDSKGAVYVSQVPESFAGYSGRQYSVQRCLHKFEPRLHDAQAY
ncbi:peptidyl-alpha-hydroxyglycine alpha-amidating lyase family protein [Burkholderia sp. SIMBA_062]|uniref:peptidyl-alpha-hydroxyglycine alpha-amidating lyase family protein n=1 Tax=Burkholderia sp. SIMBA_062 TaxID=3085803 RepID=UPI003978DCE0